VSIPDPESGEPGFESDERRLFELARQGDRRAVDELVRRFSPLLRDLLRHRMGPGLRRISSLDDLTQEVLSRVVSSLPSLDGPMNVRRFRAMLARHAGWVMQGEATRGRDFAGESAASSPETLAGAVAASGPVTHQDELRWLRALVDELDPGTAAVVRLRLEGLDFQTIGIRLSLAPETARQRYHRAVEGLREALRRRQREGGIPEGDP
jgi:RNA polymerase sigma factor (sigma-70 family)